MKALLPVLSFGAILLAARPLTPEVVPTFETQFIVWNVGQGLWTTWSGPGECDHFDSGGEHAPWRQVTEECYGKQNKFNFSHWDSDHISFAGRAAAKLKTACVERSPRGMGNARKIKSLAKIPGCLAETSDAAFSRELLPDPLRPSNRNRYFRDGSSPAPTSSNELSRVFLVNRKYLVPGDSDKKAEKTWSVRVPQEVRMLVLGHHGSRTSSSEKLLAALPLVRQAVASARFKKYGHPHKEVADRLRAHGIALLRTEDWGSLHFEITPACKRGTPCSNFSPRVRK